MSTIHTSGFYFEVENFSGWNNGVSRFYYYRTVNTNEHIYSFSYNSATITPSTDYETIVYKTNQSGWFDFDGSSNPYTLTNVNGVTSGTDSSGNVMMKWGHTGYPDPTVQGPTPDQYGRLPSTAVSKTFNKVVRRIDSDSNYVSIDTETVTGGYQTLNAPTFVWTIPNSGTLATGLVQINSYGPSITRNGVIYKPPVFGGAVGIAQYTNYAIIAFEAETPNSNVVFGVTKHYIQYSPKGYLNGVKSNIGTTTIGHSNEFLGFKYNITDNIWEYGYNTNVTSDDFIVNGITYSNITVKYDRPTISGGGDLTWSGFGIFSDGDIIVKFVVQKETNTGYDYDTAPEVSVTTTSNGGGKPDRYPLIMTNLFNRNRSIYSIGMTHKDTWDLFL